MTINSLATPLLKILIIRIYDNKSAQIKTDIFLIAVHLSTTIARSKYFL